MSQFGLYKRDKTDLVQNLMAQPPKEEKTTMPMTDPFTKAGAVHQADLLYLPEDNDHLYALVVVDIGSRKVDAEPLKEKTQTAIIWAFEAIYKRGILNYPTKMLQVDRGSEFGASTKRHFNKKNIMVRYSKAGRSRQQAVVEAYNGVIARGLFYAQYQIELKTGELNTEWVDNLPKLIKVINAHVDKKMKDFKPPPLDVRCEGKICRMLEVGTRVRVKLDKPRESTGEKLTGGFRKTDLRWDKEIRTVTEVVIRPAQPALYKVSGIENTNYSKEQLQIVK